MTRAAVRENWTTEAGGRSGLYWALKGAATDGEGLNFTKGRLREVLRATQPLAHDATNRHELRFLRQLGFAWLDAHDRAARDVIRKAIADYLPTLKIEVQA